MKKLEKFFIASLLFSTGTLVTATNGLDSVQEELLSLGKAVELAQQYDPWMVQSRQSEKAMLAQSESAGSLPDPKASITFANLPTDGFDFNQEAMTQMKLGYNQMFPAGDSLALKRQRHRQEASKQPILRQHRMALIERDVAKDWLDLFRETKSIELIKQNQQLFEQLVDVAQASYASAAGKTSQQDFVRAQLELTLLQERLAGLNQSKEVAEQKLNGKINRHYTHNYIDAVKNDFDKTTSIVLPGKITQNELSSFQGNNGADLTTQQLSQVLQLHPLVKAIEQQILADKTGIELAKQGYKTSWGLNASYGYRDDDRLGNERSDFLSLGVSFELPIFAEQKQDQQVKTASYKAEASKVRKWQAIRELTAQYKMVIVKYKRLQERENRYRDLLLPQTREHAEAALNSYTNDEGDFAEVVRARIAELNSQIDALNIAIEKQQAIFEINYFFAGVK